MAFSAEKITFTKGDLYNLEQLCKGDLYKKIINIFIVYENILVVYENI